MYRQPRLPPPSGLLGLRPTQNELMIRKEDVLDRVDQSANDRFFFYSGDRDEPRHVHVARDDRIAKFWLDPARMQRNGEQAEFYFVVETKGTNELDDKKALRESEVYKIRCALKHFDALGVDAHVNYDAPVKEYSVFKSRAKGVSHA